mgnify:CR=1 FL=1
MRPLLFFASHSLYVRRTFEARVGRKDCCPRARRLAIIRVHCFECCLRTLRKERVEGPAGPRLVALWPHHIQHTGYQNRSSSSPQWRLATRTRRPPTTSRRWRRVLVPLTCRHRAEAYFRLLERLSTSLFGGRLEIGPRPHRRTTRPILKCRTHLQCLRRFALRRFQTLGAMARTSRWPLRLSGPRFFRNLPRPRRFPFL